MAIAEHLAIMDKGVDAWNRWRLENPSVRPDLSGLLFHGTDRTLGGHVRPRLAQVPTSGTFFMADLSGADLSEATLNGTYFAGSKLRNCNLRKASLVAADLSSADLSGACLSGAWLLETCFDGTDLRSTVGLEDVRHLGGSRLDLDTIRKSWPIPTRFLEGCGYSKNSIAHLQGFIATGHYYSCFISFSSADLEFASELQRALTYHGVRSWFAPENLPIGERILPSIEEAISNSQKLLLVISKAALESEWVAEEVRIALRVEQKLRSPILLPIRLDHSILEVKDGWPRILREARNIGDFTSWRDRERHRQAFSDLLRDLTIRNTGETDHGRDSQGDGPSPSGRRTKKTRVRKT
jgi:uncharacterized protein YjbI with pentapeptide repeats